MTWKNSSIVVVGTVYMCYIQLNDFVHHSTRADAYLWSHPLALRQISQTA